MLLDPNGFCVLLLFVMAGPNGVGAAAGIVGFPNGVGVPNGWFCPGVLLPNELLLLLFVALLNAPLKGVELLLLKVLLEKLPCPN